MAGRPMGKLHQEDVRAKIQCGQLVKRLQDHALSKDDSELSASRLKAIEILLRKKVPDLAAIQLTGEGGGAVRFEVLAPWLKPSIQKRNSA